MKYHYPCHSERSEESKALSKLVHVDRFLDSSLRSE
jgi:hypothetical protein